MKVFHRESGQQNAASYFFFYKSFITLYVRGFTMLLFLVTHLFLCPVSSMPVLGDDYKKKLTLKLLLWLIGFEK